MSHVTCGKSLGPVLVLALSVATLSAQSTAQDQARLTAALKACTDARNTAITQANAVREKGMTDATAKETVGLRNCGSDQGCKEQVIDTYREETTKISNDYTLAIADISKQEIDCRTAAQTGGSTPSPTPDATTPDASGLYQLGAEVDDLRSGPLQSLLAASDSFFKGLLDWGSGVLNFLAQPRGGFGQFGTPMKQILDYLVNHKPDSFADEYNNAQAAVQQFEANPARFLGQNLPNLLPGGQATEDLGAVAKAGRTLVELNADAEKFIPLADSLVTPSKLPPVDVAPPPLSAADRGPVIPPAGSLDRVPPPDFGTGPLQPRSGVPPTCFENQCWLNAQAVNDYWRTGVWKEPAPRGYPLVEELSDLPTPGSVIINDLRRKYGGANALDPRHGEYGQLAQSLGVPVASSKAQIEAVMRSLPPGSDGYAFVRWAQTVGNEVLSGGHVVDVRTLQNQAVEFFDRATQHVAGLQGAVEPQLWANAKQVFFYLAHEGR